MLKHTYPFKQSPAQLERQQEMQQQTHLLL
jgi:hypothetical protein